MVIQAALLSPEQVVKLLPTQSEIRKLMKRIGCKKNEVDPALQRAIYQLTADIVTTPTNHVLWCDLADAFGMLQDMRWKYLFIAHQLSPCDLNVLRKLAWSCNILGDYRLALEIHNQRLALAETDEERDEIRQDIRHMQFDKRAEQVSPLLESFVSH